MNSDQLVTAKELEVRGILKKGTAYKMVAAKNSLTMSSEIPVAVFASG